MKKGASKEAKKDKGIFKSVVKGFRNSDYRVEKNAATQDKIGEKTFKRIARDVKMPDKVAAKMRKDIDEPREECPGPHVRKSVIAKVGKAEATEGG